MRREKQYDMFDVATGACTLDDYLFQRYSENDLSSSFWIDDKDEVDELRRPKPTADGTPGTEPEVIPIQGPRAPKPEGAKPTLPEPPVGLEEGPTRIPGPATTPETGLESRNVLLPANDGKDSVTRSENQVPATPSFEVFMGRSAPPTDSSDTFQPQTIELTGDFEEVTQDTPKTAAPSMDDLLARFHQATQEYRERSEPIPSQPEERLDPPESE